MKPTGKHGAQPTPLPTQPEQASPQAIQEMISSDTWKRPSWMLNESPRDLVWTMEKTGFTARRVGHGVKGAVGLHQHALTYSFDRAIAPGHLLSEPLWAPLLTDIQNTCLYLDFAGHLSRPRNLVRVAQSAIDMIHFLNETRMNAGAPLVLSLAEVSTADMQRYLSAHAFEEALFQPTLEHILRVTPPDSTVDWNLVRNQLPLTDVTFRSLKRRLSAFLNTHFRSYGSRAGRLSEYPNACLTFNCDEDLAPSSRTITNRIGNLEHAFVARPAQKYKLSVSPRRTFGNGIELFKDLTPSIKTPLVPLDVSLHAISSALEFVRRYGRSLHDYIRSLDEDLSARILRTGNTFETARARFGKTLQSESFQTTAQPPDLQNLRIDSWGDLSGEYDESDHFRSRMPLAVAFKMYAAAMWILLSAFSASRALSLRTLKRDCFDQSPLDGLFDICLLLPKTSVTNKLEAIHRPIPSLIFDFGLEFASLVTYLEERRGIRNDDSLSFLFANALHQKNISISFESGRTEHYSQGAVSLDWMREAIILFQDWTETPLTDGRRWYLATHQLRRLFAVVYFNMSKSTGLEELSWFLGHTSLDMTFHYAEISPTEEWTNEAISTIARIAKSLRSALHADDVIAQIVDESLAAAKTQVSLTIEALVEEAIRAHTKATGERVCFKRINNEAVFFYFSKAGPSE